MASARQTSHAATDLPSDGEARLRLLEAAIDAPKGFLSDVAEHAGLSVFHALRLAEDLVREGLLLAFDDESWAPTVEGYRLIQDRRTSNRRSHSSRKRVNRFTSAQSANKERGTSTRNTAKSIRATA